LERWPVNLFERLLPRHLEIIYEINSRFLRQAAARYAADPDKLERLSIFEEGPEKHLRMTNLAVVASHSVNGVAELHTELLRRTVLRDFAELFPERFNNKTNGVTPRRWLAFCNPRLAKLISSRIGERWITDLSRLRELEALVEDPQFVADFRAVKRANKEQLAAYVRDQQWLSLKPNAIFDVQIKRLHEYKRQLLNAIHVVSLWIRAKQEPASIIHPRAFIFGGKAAPGYHNAKLIIRLINGIAQVVNGESENTGIQAVFLPNYRVSLAERIFPAADVSEQISTAGKEASGTGNMKFALNGALTIGTLDGANIEIRDAVGHENFFLFGLDAQQVQLRRSTGYRPREIYEAEPMLKQALDLIASGFFSPEDPRLFQPLIDSLLNDDPYFCLADFASYAQTQEQAARAYLDGDGWAKKAILNVSRVGQFSSDRTIRQYADEIWNICPVELSP
jgi:starch phosphorylase